MYDNLHLLKQRENKHLIRNAVAEGHLTYVVYSDFTVHNTEKLRHGRYHDNGGGQQ